MDCWLVYSKRLHRRRPHLCIEESHRRPLPPIPLLYVVGQKLATWVPQSLNKYLFMLLCSYMQSFSMFLGILSRRRQGKTSGTHAEEHHAVVECGQSNAGFLSKQFGFITCVFHFPQPFKKLKIKKKWTSKAAAVAGRDQDSGQLSSEWWAWITLANPRGEGAKLYLQVN